MGKGNKKFKYNIGGSNFESLRGRDGPGSYAEQNHQDGAWKRKRGRIEYWE